MLRFQPIALYKIIAKSLDSGIIVYVHLDIHTRCNIGKGEGFSCE